MQIFILCFHSNTIQHFTRQDKWLCLNFVCLILIDFWYLTSNCSSIFVYCPVQFWKPGFNTTNRPIKSVFDYSIFSRKKNLCGTIQWNAFIFNGTIAYMCAFQITNFKFNIKWLPLKRVSIFLAKIMLT